MAAFALRLWRLGGESLWYDETVSVALAQLPAAELVARTAGDIHPPGYYLLLHLWQRIAHPVPVAPITDVPGASAGSAQPLEFLYAWVSLMGAMLIVALLVPLGRRLAGPRALLPALALAVLNPFHIWYAQEVRMYTVAGALGLLCLWATLRWMESGRRSALALYVVAAAAGLWSLYYFAFLLAGVAAAALLLAPGWRRLTGWIAAQAGVLLLYAPWLPVLWRQATDPPVPPWRMPWDDAAALLASVAEALAAPLLGQVRPGPSALWSPPLFAMTVLALAVLGLTALFLLRGEVAPRRRLALVMALFVPTLLLFAVSLVGPPLYHARYLFPWSAAFPLAGGGALAALPRSRPGTGAAWAGGAALALASLLALRTFWSDPAYAADDHRSAVRALAAAWRPGDAILVNAGWAWTPLAVYWPRGANGSRYTSAAPPPLAPRLRLKDVAAGAPLPPVMDLMEALPPALPLTVPLIRTGSVGGGSSLGWGDPASDFFAISAAESAEGLQRLAVAYDRLWHYRIYDTVSDPAGDLRAWLEANALLLRDDAITGRDYGRLQLYDLPGSLSPSPDASATPSGDLWLAGEGGSLSDGNGAALRVLEAVAQPPAEAGAIVYARVVVEPLPPLAELGVGISSSLRLFDATGAQVAQADESPAIPSTAWPAGTPVTLALAVPAPDPLPPGPLTVELILYRQDNAAPLPVAGPAAVEGVRLRLR